MKYYHDRANAIREEVNNRDEIHNVRYQGDYALLYKGRIVSQLINKTIQSIDTNQSKE